MWKATIEVEDELNDTIVESMLRALISADSTYLAKHPETPPLYQSGVVYQRDQPGKEKWKTIPGVLRRGSGDCKDFASWRVAELLRRGDRARVVLRKRQRPDGSWLYHIVVQRGDGSLEDPSRILGMTG